MRLRRVIPANGGELDLTAEDADRQLADWYAPGADTTLRLLMIATLDGRIVGADGTSASISSPTDRRVLQAVRAHAHVIVVGAHTVRRESVGRPAGTALAVVSATGALEGHRLTPAQDDAPLIIITTPSGADRARAALGSLSHELLTLPAEYEGRPDILSIVAAVRGQGYAHVVCEGGPALAQQVVAAGLLDELCLTTAPTIGGGGALLGPDTLDTTRLAPTQLLIDEAGFSYGRWVPAAR
jgi:riboflavin biosynthesis pyrimidine reductase